VLGGLTGVMLASVPLNLQVHDTFFVVAHFHYVLIGGALFPLFGAFFHWYPKMTGRMMNEFLGKITFWVLFIGFNVTFFPMHILGLHGMPRRIYTYPPETGWGTLNQLATSGAFLIALGGILFIANVFWSRKHGAVAGHNPWDADSLEWAAASPPENYNFEYLPVVTSRAPLWVAREDRTFVTGLRNDRREVLVTTLMDATPRFRYVLPSSSIWPFITAVAVAVGFVGSVFNPWYVITGSVLTGLGLLGWFWPRRPVELEP
jgi:cytochrome c oxidase subunit 1